MKYDQGEIKLITESLAQEIKPMLSHFLKFIGIFDADAGIERAQSQEPKDFKAGN